MSEGFLHYSDVEQCRLLMNSPRVKTLLDQAVAWCEQEQRRRVMQQSMPVHVVEV
ncbi:MAG: hypothetical protein LBC03_05590 [Nitrososphaerota archaeon]|jgi:hypothetical protein|nr:hypothetical protein [Nitrososphaerota archaeon]